MIQTFKLDLPHGITLSCRAAGEPGRPVLVFLHGFPEAAFVWDATLEHFAKPENGGYRCVAPNMRGYEDSSSPADPAAYRAKLLVQDIAALIAHESPGRPLVALVAHDWGGAIAWNLANQKPELMQRLCIINSPHLGTFLRELKTSPQQQAASAYMNFLVRPDAEKLLAEDDFRRLWEMFINMGAGTSPGKVPRPEGGGWLTDAVREQYRAVWSKGLTGGCNFYRASPLRPSTSGDSAINDLTLPREMLTVNVPVMVIWGMNDMALMPGLIEGLDEYIPDLTIHRLETATHWVVHEQPARVAQLLGDFIGKRPKTPA